jgi:hypothetical protein
MPKVAVVKDRPEVNALQKWLFFSADRKDGVKSAFCHNLSNRYYNGST